MELPLLEEVEPLELLEAPPKAKKEGKVLLTTKGGRKVTVEDQVANKVKTISEIVAALIQAHNEGKNVNVTKLKSQLSSKNKLTESPKTVDIIAAIPDAFRKVLIPKLKTKPVRTASGVRFHAQFTSRRSRFTQIAVVAVMCKPHRCPHIAFTGNICVYCPGGPDSDFEYSTQSYTGYEPTSMRAIRARYNPYLQTRHRVDQLKRLGHSVDKVPFSIWACLVGVVRECDESSLLGSAV